MSAQTWRKNVRRAGGERLAGEGGSGGACRAEDGEFHRVRRAFRYIDSVTHIIRRSYHMESVLPGDPGTAPHRGRLNRAIKESLRDLGAQLWLLNHSWAPRSRSDSLIARFSRPRCGAVPGSPGSTDSI